MYCNLNFIQDSSIDNQNIITELRKIFKGELTSVEQLPTNKFHRHLCEISEGSGGVPSWEDVYIDDESNPTRCILRSPKKSEVGYNYLEMKWLTTNLIKNSTTNNNGTIPSHNYSGIVISISDSFSNNQLVQPITTKSVNYEYGSIYSSSTWSYRYTNAIFSNINTTKPLKIYTFDNDLYILSQSHVQSHQSMSWEYRNWSWTTYVLRTHTNYYQYSALIGLVDVSHLTHEDDSMKFVYLSSNYRLNQGTTIAVPTTPTFVLSRKHIYNPYTQTLSAQVADESITDYPMTNAVRTENSMLLYPIVFVNDVENSRIHFSNLSNIWFASSFHLEDTKFTKNGQEYHIHKISDVSPNNQVKLVIKK